DLLDAFVGHEEGDGLALQSVVGHGFPLRGSLAVSSFPGAYPRGRGGQTTAPVGVACSEADGPVPPSSSNSEWKWTARRRSRDGGPTATSHLVSASRPPGGATGCGRTVSAAVDPLQRDRSHPTVEPCAIRAVLATDRS